MSVDPKKMSKYHGEKITVVYVPPGADEAVEQEGVAQVSNEIGVLFKQRGKTMAVFIEIDKIEDIFLLPDRPKPIKIKVLKDVSLEAARQHLVDRHGIPVKRIEELDDVDAMEGHDCMDHSILGHIHKSEAGANEEQDEGAAHPA